ncbi:NAD(P)H-dependent glycerol-3-phosphate dehydrogenase [Labrys wisconsinensis]|uniref:Glycerol-3-phosphate dehydrogenase [NAD(P)+] n=1 Tax=Labrys wisconsinensis TaxID=425677 RepID=A0ABU0J480_9HYPH|nr:NAD(P)H-dependent glycerol-3-phosphate dehydrogenase [Labrys wisconsinensis]MDQ0468002.1 glycerol-3-phosphate dehydrogenase (NAD(P)+) [Labrys wisconsinensis]
MRRFDVVAVVGAGAFGTALACAAARAGRRALLWARDADQAAAMAASRRSPRLPEAVLPPAVTPSAAPDDLRRAEAVILAVPTQNLAAAAAALASVLAPDVPVIAAAKGIERSTGRFVTEIVAAALPRAVPAILSGPGFAADIAAGSPTALTLACAEAATGEALALALGSPTFRLYHATDMRGVEIGGAAKNVLAIAAGIAAGKGFGESAVAALIARAFAELTRFGVAYGARAETLAGLSGLGDLVLTGTSSRSRNRRLGEALGRGLAVEAAVAAVGLAEGVWTAGILAEMAAAKGVDMPVAQAVADLIAGRLTVDAAIEVLLSRPLKAEA